MAPIAPHFAESTLPARLLWRLTGRAKRRHKLLHLSCYPANVSPILVGWVVFGGEGDLLIVSDVPSAPSPLWHMYVMGRVNVRSKRPRLLGRSWE